MRIPKKIFSFFSLVFLLPLSATKILVVFFLFFLTKRIGKTFERGYAGIHGEREREREREREFALLE